MLTPVPAPLATVSEVSMSHFSAVENDLRAIEVMNQRDVEAALAGDTATSGASG